MAEQIVQISGTATPVGGMVRVLEKLTEAHKVSVQSAVIFTPEGEHFVEFDEPVTLNISSPTMPEFAVNKPTEETT